MADFKGYLMKSTSNNAIFPHKYIQIDSFSTTPNAREEIKAVRDENTRNLTRVTASGTKSSITFLTLDGLNKSQVEEILNFFTTAETNALQRKLQLIYWNMEELKYKTGYFYRPDITYQIREISNNDFICNEFEISLIEY